MGEEKKGKEIPVKGSGEGKLKGKYGEKTHRERQGKWRGERKNIKNDRIFQEYL